MISEKTKISVWLSEVLGPCSNKLRRLCECFGSFEEIFAARASDEVAKLLSAAELKRMRTERVSDNDRIFEYCERSAVEIVSYEDPAYPRRLRESSVPPVVLYVTGDKNILESPAVAGVGSRHSTQYGRDTVRFLCEPLAASGITLVSGLAAGTDTEVHKSALKVGGKTIAVLGTGIDETYPKGHSEVRKLIEQNGAVVSEYPPFTKNAPYMFAVRNRIISGLSLAVVIFEAAKRSGTMITAGWALDDGRDVFAVPGSIFSDKSEGTNRLLKQGAIPALSAEDILDALGIAGASAGTVSQKKSERPRLRGSGKIIYDILVEGAQNLDTLVENTGISSGELLSCLTLLELEGIVKALPGRRYEVV